MKAVLQRCTSASVIADGVPTGKIEHGLLILLGVLKGDTQNDCDLLAEKICKLRIFDDENGKLNLSLRDVLGSVLIISNFTLGANYRKGNRPDYMNSEAPARANELYEYFISAMRERGVKAETGKFGADMKITLCADGPVTIDMDSTVLKNKDRE